MFSAFDLTLTLNALWFGAAFQLFSLRPDVAARILVPRSARESPLFRTLAASLRFLGGMNLALMVLAVLLLVTESLFPDPRQRAVFAVVFAVAHASQCAFNVPIALGGGRQGDALWSVLRGPMLFIFAGDFALTIVNAMLAAALLCS